MEFDIKRVYTSVNADEVKVGSKVIVAYNFGVLKNSVLGGIGNDVLQDVKSEFEKKRFVVNGFSFPLAYLVEEPEEKKLKWTDLKVKDVIKRGKEKAEVIYINEEGIEGRPNIHLWVGYIGVIRDEELEDWEKVEEL